MIWRTASTSSAPTTDVPVRARSMRAVPSSSWARGMATPAVVKAATARKRRRSTSARPRSVAARTGSRSAGPSVSGACRPISIWLVGSLTVAEWLDRWLAGKRIRKSGISRYETDVRVHLKPHIGDRRLDRLCVSQLSEMFTAITDANAEILEQNAQRRAAVEELAAVPRKGLENRARRKAVKAAIDAMPPFRRVTGPSTRQHFKAILRAALNDAIGQQIITFNPAAHVEIDPVRKPKALVWTDEHVARWQQTGEKPSPVMVWTPEQTGAFLDFVAEDRLYAMWHLIAFRGLRRGEACGQPWSETNLDRHSLTVTGQLVQDGWEVGSRRRSRRRTAASESSPSTTTPSTYWSGTGSSRRRTARSGALSGSRPASSSRRKTAPGYTPARSPTSSSDSLPPPARRGHAHARR